MRVLREGRYPVEWYLRVINTCGFCGAQYVLEQGDAFVPQFERNIVAVESQCPNCARTVWTELGAAEAPEVEV